MLSDIGACQVDTSHLRRIDKLLQYALCKRNDIVGLASDVAFTFHFVNELKVCGFDFAEVTLLILRYISG